MPKRLYALTHRVAEWSYTSTLAYAEPFSDIELDVIISHPNGGTWRVPAYWAGAGEWRVRFAPPNPGAYTAVSCCSDDTNAGLHKVTYTLEAMPYPHASGLAAHGGLRVAPSGRSLEHTDGTPFFWLGDTWWMGLCGRLSWPEDFQRLTADRVAKGFTVIQIVAGLYPDMPGFDPRGTNEAGFPWEPEYSRINPAYFDAADLRIQWLVRSNLTPCIVGCWGYYLPLLGIEKVRQHWRYLIARWGAYPVIWCLAGEAAMPYYLSQDKEADRRQQITGWTEIARYVQATDPFNRPVTIHPTQVGRDQVADAAVLDLDMLQTGHGGQASVPNTITQVSAGYWRTPTMPVVVGEVSYEGFMHATQAEVQRWTFWAAILSGAGGYTYGANGIWQVNTREHPYGPSPHGGTWGNTAWDEAYQLPGSRQIGLAKQLLERYRWWAFAPHPEWVQPTGNPDHPGAPFAAGIPGEVRIFYCYDLITPWQPERPRVTHLEAGVTYSAFFWDPASGTEYPIGAVTADASGIWEIPLPPVFQDWVIVLEG